MQRLSTRHAGTANSYGLVGLASLVQDASTLGELGRSEATSDSLGSVAHAGWRIVSAFARCCVILALLAFCVPGSSSQGSVSKLRVATREVPPMVIEDKGALRGFSIDLWNSISARLNRATEYLVMSDVGELPDAVGDGRADLGIAAISITSEREGRFDFSQPILNAGLQILVRGAAENAEPSPVHLMRLFFSRTLLIWLGIALLLIMIPAHLVWVVERHHRNGIIPSRNYFPGIFHAMFWAAGTLATQADHMPRHWIARIVAVLWMFTAGGCLGFFTSHPPGSLHPRTNKGAVQRTPVLGWPAVAPRAAMAS